MSIARLLALAAAVLLLVGPAAPADAAMAAADPVLAQPAPGGGFGDDGEITDRYGTPVSEYEVGGREPSGFDIGGYLAALPLNIAGLGFWFIKWLVLALVWGLGFALEFGAATTLLTPVRELIDVYQSFVDQLGLVPLALMLCVFWFGLAALRGRVGRGAVEIILSFVLVVVLGGVLAAPGQVLLGEEGMLGRARDIGALVAVLPLQDPQVTACAPAPSSEDAEQVDGCAPGQSPPPAPTAAEPEVLRWIVQTWLVDMYVRQPHQYLVYGQRLDCPMGLRVRDGPADDPPADGGCRPHPCLDRYNQILRTNSAEVEERIRATREPSDGPEEPPELGLGDDLGVPPVEPWSEPDSYLHDMMHPERDWYAQDGGCGEDGRELAAYNDSGDWGRVGMAILVLVALLVLAVYLAAAVLLPLIVGQVMVALLAVALVFVLPVALLGGGARQVLWKWFGLLLAALLLIVMSLVGLSLMLVTTDLLLRGNWHLSVSLLLVCVSAVVFLRVQRGLLSGGMAGGVGAGAALAARSSGGSSGGSPHGAGAPGWSRVATAGIDQGSRGIARGGRMAAQKGQAVGSAAATASRRTGGAATHQTARVATFGRYRDRRRERKKIAGEYRNREKVLTKHPEYLERQVARELEARDKWQRQRREGT